MACATPSWRRCGASWSAASALDAVPRNLLARDLAERLRPSVGGVGGELAPERFLELIAALRRIRT